MNSAPCNCHTQTSKPSVNERPRYYARQLVTPDDLTLEQDYFRARLRRHNRYLHGWGVVCGAQVVNAFQVGANGQQQNRPWKVIVKAGYVLGPYGDEIFIEKDQCVDVRKLCVTPEPSDEDECLEAQPVPADSENETRWLAIRYVEDKSRLIRVPVGGCGCEDNTCEYTRFVDRYQICVIDHCPDSHQNPPGMIGNENGEPAPDCPECVDEPWVVLSAFTTNESGDVELQQCGCRRQVFSLGNSWWACSSDERRAQPTDSQQPLPPPAPAAAEAEVTKLATKGAVKKGKTTPVS
jgi:hypothetical protein